MINFPKTAKIATGASRVIDWQQYENKDGVKDGVFVDIDTSAAKFSKTPIYITAINGFRWHWNTIGASSIYYASPTGFQVYIRWADGATLDVEKAKQGGWYIQWIGIED